MALRLRRPPAVGETTRSTPQPAPKAAKRKPKPGDDMGGDNIPY